VLVWLLAELGIRHARHARLVADSYVSGRGRVGEDVTRMLRGCYEETAIVEFRLNKTQTEVSIAHNIKRYKTVSLRSA